MKEFEVAWREIRKNGTIMYKRAAFADAAKRFKFVLRLEKRDGFDCIVGWRDPADKPLVLAY